MFPRTKHQGSCKYCGKRIRNRIYYCKFCASLVQRIRTAIFNERLYKMEREKKKEIEAEKKKDKPFVMAFDCPNDPIID